jgi:hypothetical protein
MSQNEALPLEIDDILAIPRDEVDRAVLGELVDSISHHAPQDSSLEKIREVRQAAIEFGAFIVKNCSAGRERALAITNLEQSVMWAVKGIVLQNR